MGRGSRQEAFSREERKGGCICKETEEVFGEGGGGVGRSAEAWGWGRLQKPRNRPLGSPAESPPRKRRILLHKLVCLSPEGQLILDSSF